ncbi:MAG TPA: MBL fold metallo-hydrolase, partial [Candidatus Krumholzibacteria bacterium]
MILQQFYLGCLAHASYIVADEESGVACVVDPQRDVDGYVEFAREHGLRIEHVLLSHLHADFLAGHLELRDRCGARIHLGAAAEAEYDFAPMDDGGTLELGPRVALRFLSTPGHTPESSCIVVQQEGRDHAALTGDTLFIGDVGRPDLLVSVGMTAEELSEKMFDSLHEKLGTLADSVIVFPAHGASSACGTNISSEKQSTLGRQRAINWALQPMDRQEFVARLSGAQSSPPAYFSYDAKLNRRELPTLSAVLEEVLRPLTVARFMELRAGGAQILDTRSTADFAKRHLEQSIFVGLGGDYASWAGSILDPEVEIALIAEPGREREAALRLGRIGFDNIAGYVEGGFGAIAASGDCDALLDSWERWDGGRIASELSSPESVFL